MIINIQFTESITTSFQQQSTVLSSLGWSLSNPGPRSACREGTELFILHLLTTIQFMLAIYTPEESGGSETWEKSKTTLHWLLCCSSAVSALTTASLVYAFETCMEWRGTDAASSDQSMLAVGAPQGKTYHIQSSCGRSHSKEPSTMKAVIHSETATRPRMFAVRID